MVGTIVRDHMYDASIAKETASASGTNKNRATPDRKNMGMNTMQMHSVETNAGTAICCAPSRMACTVSLPMARLRLMFSISTVASSTKMPTASASPPRVIMLMVSPSALSNRMLTRIDSGMEVAMISVLFQLPRKSTLIIATSIPLSILVSILLLSALGETINIMTLGGLALAVGILVDDATVEIENINRNLAMGKETVQAILDGAQQIAVPAFVSTLCICIVFIPMFFLSGVAKYL